MKTLNQKVSLHLMNVFCGSGDDDFLLAQQKFCIEFSTGKATKSQQFENCIFITSFEG